MSANKTFPPPFTLFSNFSQHWVLGEAIKKLVWQIGQKGKGYDREKSIQSLMTTGFCSWSSLRWRKEQALILMEDILILGTIHFHYWTGTVFCDLKWQGNYLYTEGWQKKYQVLQSFLTQPAPREWVSKDSGRQSKDALWSHIMSYVCSIQRLPNYLIFIECCHMSGTALVLRIQQQTRQISTILGIGYYRENGMQTDKKWLYK